MKILLSSDGIFLYEIYETKTKMQFETECELIRIKSSDIKFVYIRYCFLFIRKYLSVHGKGKIKVFGDILMLQTFRMPDEPFKPHFS